MKTRSMKCTFVGVFTESSTNFSQFHALRKEGCEIQTFAYRDIAKKVGREERDAMLIGEVKRFSPDVLLIAKGNTIDADTIKECNKHTKSVLWFMDTLYTWNRELEEKIEACNVVACAWKGPYRRACMMSNNVYHVIEGYDETLEKPVSVEQSVLVSFIGSLQGDRPRYVEAVNAVVFQDAYGAQHSVVVSKSKININLTRRGGTSDRVYKVLAAKGFLLSQKWDGMEEELCPGKDFVLFDNPESLTEKVNYYLTHNDERESIREHGYQTVQKYTRREWAKKILEIAK